MRAARRRGEGPSVPAFHMAAELIALTSERPVLVLAPKNLLLQWQEERRAGHDLHVLGQRQ
jgi:hypothetical protein